MNEALPSSDDDEWVIEPEAPIRLASALEMWRQLAPWMGGVRVQLPVIGGLGLIGAALDGVGVGLVVLFLDMLIGGSSAIGMLTDMLGDEVGQVLAWLTARPAILAGLLAALFLGKIGANIAHALLVSRVEQRVNHELRRAAYATLLHRPHALMMGYGKARILTIFDRHIFSVTEALDSYFILVQATLAVLVLGTLALIASWPVTLAALIAGLVQSLLLGRVRRASSRASEGSVERLREMNAVLMGTLDALRTIRIFGQEPRYEARFADRSRAVRDADVALERHTSLTEPLTELVALIVLTLCGLTALALGIPAIQALTAIAILSRLQPHITAFEGARLALARIAAPFGAMIDLLAPGESRIAGERRIEGLGAGIEFDGVGFAHAGDRPVLDRASFVIPAGRWTWLAGASGSGKSTIVNLVAGLYTPQAGEVRIAGVPIPEISRASLTARLAFAGQDVELFDGSLEDNLRWARPDADRAAVEAAARDADIHDFIASLPLGYRTPVSDRALDLSGGQRQRIGLARALLRDPDLLILDEATNAVGGESEARIMAAVRRRMAGRTVLIISHHAPDIRPGDHLLSIDRGRVTTLAEAA